MTQGDPGVPRFCQLPYETVVDEVSELTDIAEVEILATGDRIHTFFLLRASDSQFYNLQDASIRFSFERDQNSFTREIEALPGNITNIVVDEIQKVPSLLDEIQYLYDNDPGRHQFYLTGSSARSLKRHSASLLPGRCHLYNLSK